MSVEAVRELCRRGVLEQLRVVNAIRIPRAEFERLATAGMVLSANASVAPAGEL